MAGGSNGKANSRSTKAPARNGKAAARNGKPAGRNGRATDARNGATKAANANSTAAPRNGSPVPAQLPWCNEVIQGDCIKHLNQMPEGCVDLVFADPPFNIGFTYDTYEDNLEEGEYRDWTRQWMSACTRVLKPDGSFYIAIGAEFAADIRILSRELGLHLRNWIIWHYTFGQSTKAMFARSHVHIFYFVRDASSFVFNDQQIRIPSARHTEYSDKRANPMGKTPDDVWDDFPRVCGTYKERMGWHGCQMPEALLTRIIRASSNPGDLVIDPFSGSGTTVVTARKLGRRYLGFDLSPDYVKQGQMRLAKAEEEEQQARQEGPWAKFVLENLCSLYRETGTAWFRLRPNDVAMDCFTRLLNERLGTAFTREEVVEKMEELARSSDLPRLRNDRHYRGGSPIVDA